MTPHVLTYGDKGIPYTVVPDASRKSRIAVHVNHNGLVTVRVPEGASEASIREAVRKRARWIVVQVEQAERRFRHVRSKDYVSGEEVLYLGRRYVLKVIPVERSQRSVKLVAGRLEVRVPDTSPGSVRARVRAWYRWRGRDYFHHRLHELAREYPWVASPPPFQIREMAGRWGTCSVEGRIVLNQHLIKAPRPAIDYVLTHELAHLAVHDHGPWFVALLDRHVPDWRRTKRSLDEMVEVLTAD